MNTLEALKILGLSGCPAHPRSSEDRRTLSAWKTLYTRRIHKQGEQTMRRQQRQRDRAAERLSRRRKREQTLNRLSAGLPDDLARSILQSGLAREARPVNSVRGRLIARIAREAIWDGQQWVFDGSLRDLAAGGLDGQKHAASYFRSCLADLVKRGILEKLAARKGKPTVYRIVQK